MEETIQMVNRIPSKHYPWCSCSA